MVVQPLSRNLPPETPAEHKLPPSLLNWMDRRFKVFGDIYRASLYGDHVYFSRDPYHAEHILRANWQNYVKGTTTKRIGLLLGNGLIVSEGAFWKRQRRMIQPAFHRDAVGALTSVMVSANAALIEDWERAARA